MKQHGHKTRIKFMKARKHQKGIIPIIVLVGLATALIGGFIGFQLGDGTFFSFGVGVGVVLLFGPLIITYVKKLKKSLSEVDEG